ncbi:MAG: TetR/AcrR family transcriptional regulator [Prevotellaceae bacterium]|jgi:AcrR family transcriptional regulator|nr:TetR/AcrR family transcriptional regulator [Prevotellaceae bacterium]
MELKNANTEQLILDAAEKIFLDKGFSGAKTTDIANAAGVNHALLHYYFHTKENLFNKVFENKADLLLMTFKTSFDTDLPFLEKIRITIESHFDFIGVNPKIPMFILREVVSNKEKRDFIIEKIFPRAYSVLEQLRKSIDEEVGKGTISPVEPIDLMMNIASLNVLSYVAAQVYFNFGNENTDELNKFLSQRKKNNVEVILKSLKP